MKRSAVTLKNVASFFACSLLMERLPFKTSEKRPRMATIGSRSLVVRPLVSIRYPSISLGGTGGNGWWRSSWAWTRIAMVSNSADSSGAGLPTTPFGFGNSTGVRGFFPGDRRYPGCGGEKAGGHRVDSYPNARSRPTGSRIPPPNRRAVVAGIKEEVLVWLPRESLVLIRSRRARGHHAWFWESYLSAPRSHGKLGGQKVDGFGGRLP